MPLQTHVIARVITSCIPGLHGGECEINVKILSEKLTYIGEDVIINSVKSINRAEIRGKGG